MVNGENQANAYIFYARMWSTSGVGDLISIACDGQMATQAPQPVQASEAINGVGGVPIAY